MNLIAGGMMMSALGDGDGSGDVSSGGSSEGDLAVVRRKGMNERVVNDRHGRAVTIYGQNKSASRTPGHDELIEAEALRMAETGEYEYITMQRAWRTATGRQVKSRRIPDIIGVRRNGKIDAVEVKSATDEYKVLKRRLDEVMKTIPDERRGGHKILEPRK